MSRRTGLASCLALAGLLLAVPARAEDFVIHTILPITGNASFIGTARQKTLELVEALVNREGGIAGRNLKLAFHDDQTSPQITVQIVTSLMPEHPAVLLGSSVTGMCNAELPMINRAGPVAYCFSPGVHPKPGSFMFSIGVDTHDQVKVLFHNLKQRGWNRVATISSTDATGQEIDDAFTAIGHDPDMEGVQLVDRERFNLSDVTVSAQIERIKAAQPDVIIAWTTGTAVASVFKGLIQAGVDVPVVTSNGNMSNAVMRQFAGFLPKTLMVPSSVFAPHDGAYLLDARVEARQKQYYDTMRQAGLPIDFLSAAVWDSTFLMVEALRRLGPAATAEQVRADIAGQSDFAGINGVYDFKRTPQRGLDATNSALWRWDAAGDAWVPASKPGGDKLD